VDRHEQIGGLLVGQGDPLPQGQGHVAIAREEHVDAAGGEAVAHREGQGQGQVLLEEAGHRADRAAVGAAMAGVEDDQRSRARGRGRGVAARRRGQGDQGEAGSRQRLHDM
jgi:hypothetical protein